MIKLASTSISPKSPETFHLALSVLVGFYAMVPIASASGLVPRAYEDIDPRTMSCSIGFHQSEYQIESTNSRTQDIYIMASEVALTILLFRRNDWRKVVYRWWLHVVQ